VEIELAEAGVDLKF